MKPRRSAPNLDAQSAPLGKGAGTQLEFLLDAAPAVAAPEQPAAPPPAPAVEQVLPPGARWPEVMAEGRTIRFVLQRSRRRTIGFVVSDDGLRVTAPRWVGMAEIDAAVREKSRWILSKLHDWQNRKERLWSCMVSTPHAQQLTLARRIPPVHG